MLQHQEFHLQSLELIIVKQLDVKLYEKLGFVIRQKLNAYYRDGEDAYLMAIELD